MTGVQTCALPICKRAIKICLQASLAGLVFCLCLSYFAEPRIDHVIKAFLFLGATILVLIFQIENQYREQTYECNINELILAMYSNGLVLSTLGNNLYIFKSNNMVLPNNHFVIKDYIEYCSILGRKGALRRLQYSLDLSKK